MNAARASWLFAAVVWAVALCGGGWLVWRGTEGSVARLQQARSKLDSLSHLNDAVLRLGAHGRDTSLGSWPSLSLTEIDSLASVDRIRLLKNASVPVGGGGVEYRLAVEASYPDMVAWMGRLELPYRNCRVEKWNFVASDPNGGDVKGDLDLACQGRSR